MNFNSLRKDIKSKNASVKEIVNDIFSKIDFGNLESLGNSSSSSTTPSPSLSGGKISSK